LATIAVAKMVRLTLNYGLSSGSPEAFSIAGGVCIAQSRDVKEGHRLGTIAAAQLFARQGSHASNNTGVTFIVNGTLWWRTPVGQGLEPLLEGYRTSMRDGDINSAFHCAVSYGESYLSRPRFDSSLTAQPMTLGI